jgi:uncharacterized membrane protein YkvA (DUF1232 family)
MLLEIALSLVASLVLLWLVFLVALALSRPDKRGLSDAVRIVPDTVRLVRRLAADRELGRAVRVRLWLLLVYLALPIDLVPDFIPVLGYADDAIVTGLVLRSVIKRAGPGLVQQQWPGTPDGLSTLARLCRLPQLGDHGTT